MADVNIQIKTTLEGLQKSTKNLNDFASKATRQVSKIQDSFKKVTSSLSIFRSGITKAAVGFTALNQGIQLVERLARVFAAPIAAASQQEDAINELNTALALSGKFSEQASKDFQEYASSLQAVTKFGDEVILQTAALIQSLGKLDQESLKQATAATLDLASALRIDLNAAALLVGKAAQGQIDTFTRYGVSIRKGKDAAETFANTLEALQKNFGGAAAAQVKTFSGAITQLGNIFGDVVLENIGNGIVKNRVFIETIRQLSIALGSANDEFQDLGRGIGEVLVKGIRLAVDGFGILIRAISKVDTALTAAKNGAVALVKNLIDIPKRIKGLVTLDFKFLDDNTIKRSRELEDSFAGLAKREKSYAKIAESVAKFSVALEKADPSNIDKVNKSFERLSRAAREAAFEAGENLPESIEKLQKKFANAGLDRVQILQKEQAATLKIVEDFAKKDIAAKKTAAKLKAQIELDFATKIVAEEEKIRAEQRKKELEEIRRQKDRISSLISGDVQKIVTEIQVGGKLDTVVDFGAIGASITKAVSGGAEGAKKAVAGAFGAIANTLLPGIGQSVAEIVNFLAQGPEKVAATVEAFITAIPDIIANVIEAIPALLITIFENLDVFVEQLLISLGEALQTLIISIPDIVFALIEAVPDVIFAMVEQIPVFIEKLLEGAVMMVQKLVENAPMIITKLVSSVPKIITSFISQLPRITTEVIKALPKIATQFAIGLIKEAPNIAINIAKEFINQIPEIAKGIGEAAKEAILNAIPGGKGIESFLKDPGKALENVGKDIEGFFKDPIGSIGGFLGLQTGGMVPKGFPDDSFPAALTSGEYVIDRDLTSELSSFLAKERQGQSSQNNAILTLLASIDAKLNQQQVIVNVGDREVLNVINESIQAGRVLL